MFKIVTHGAKFHTDDVFAVATLMIMLGKENSEVTRTRDENLIALGDYVVDVGGVDDASKNRFDHHQPGGAGKRANGVPYASFGLVWREFGPKVSGSQEAADVIDRIIVQGVDSGDTGFDTFTLSVSDTSLYFIGDAINLFRPTWKEEDDWDNRFDKAVEWAIRIMERQIKVVRDEIEADAVVKNVYESSNDKKLIIFGDEQAFGREIIARVLVNYPEPIYAVLIRPDHGNWQVVAIRQTHDTFAMRKPLPEEWRGRKDSELRDITGVQTAVFCHNSGFMCVADSKEDALALAQKALNA